MLALGRLVRTVRWLKPAQVIGRARIRLQRPRVDLRPAPQRATPVGRWVRPAAREPSLLGPTTLRFLGETHELDACDWDDPAIALLWRYNLHYFDDLQAAGSAERASWQRALVSRWLRENPPGRGTAWAPYPTSLRIVNWVKWFACGAPAELAWLDSLAAQARWLGRRLEWHLLGNHLFANAKALVHAGVFFRGDEAAGWLETGLRILAREVPEQMLADGGQFERSPMYHALALEDLLDLVNVVEHLAPPDSPARAALPDWRARAASALEWLRTMVHPDGSLARFNDTADGIAPTVAELERYARDLGIEAAQPPVEGTVHLEPSGYARLTRCGAVLLVDLAPVGPDYLPGHAHADTLGFELALHGQPVLVNRGTSVYGTGPRRLLERGTAAHNTVQLDGIDSSEVWSGFRVGRRARPVDVVVDGFDVTGAHDGYRHLRGRPTHRRRWRFGDGDLRVEDTIEWGSRPSPAPAGVARFHLHPRFTLRPDGAGVWRVLDAEANVARIMVEHGQANEEAWSHGSRFGVLEPARTLAVTLVDDRSVVRLTWT